MDVKNGCVCWMMMSRRSLQLGELKGGSEMGGTGALFVY